MKVILIYSNLFRSKEGLNNQIYIIIAFMVYIDVLLQSHR